MVTWTNELVLDFLELYKKEPALWDPKHPAHRNRSEVSDAWVRIQISLAIQSTIVDLKKKKESLMTSFRMHLSKKKSQEGYQTTWFAYPLMESFLGGKYECDSTIENEFFDPSFTSTTQQTDPNIHTAEMTTTPPKRPFKPSPPQQTKNKSNPESPKRDPQPYYSKSQPEGADMDEYDLYGQLIAKKLRKLDEHQRDVTMHEIDNLMFRAKMQSSRGSFSTSPTPAQKKAKSPLFLVAPTSHPHFEEGNLPYQQHMQPPEPS